MKKMIFFYVMMVLAAPLMAQMRPPTYSSGTTDDETKGFKKENIFIGGTLSVGFEGNTFSVGGNPEIGYSVAQWLDAGVVVNLNYYSQRAVGDPYNPQYNENIRTREFNYGGGVFARIYPVRFLFIQLQPEQNWVHFSQKDYNSDASLSGTTNAFSFIGGVGYASRVVGEGSYFIMIGLDLANNLYSPYRENGVAIPIVRAGFDFYLKSGKKK